MKEEEVELEGVVRDAQKNQFVIELDDSQNQEGEKYKVSAYLAGKLRKNRIKVVVGDRVRVAVSPYDMSRGRITYRMK